MTKTPIRIFVSSAHVERAFADRLEADAYQRGRWFSWGWIVLRLLRQGVLHA